MITIVFNAIGTDRDKRTETLREKLNLFLYRHKKRHKEKLLYSKKYTRRNEISSVGYVMNEMKRSII